MFVDFEMNEYDALLLLLLRINVEGASIALLCIYGSKMHVISKNIDCKLTALHNAIPFNNLLPHSICFMIETLQ